MPTLFNAVRCLECGATMPADPFITKCTACGSAWLDARYDLSALPADWTTQVKQRDYNLWRYEEFIPFPTDFQHVSLGEGCTPLTRAEGLQRETGHPGIWIKDERFSSTGSFKDRQAAAAVSALKARGVQEVVLASTGNAGAAYAAYCARAGIKLWLFVVSSVPAEKMRELALYDAEVIKVTGTYDEAKVVARDFAQRRGIYIDGGAKSIPCKESMKTIAFEIAEQMPRGEGLLTPWQAPDWYIQAVSGGIGPLGVLKGFEELYAAGIVDRVPKIGVVQTEGCNPMVRAFNEGLAQAIDVVQPDSLITVLSTGKPGKAYEILKQAADRYGGAMVDVSDGDAFRAMRRIAALEGISMEPAASVAFAGLEKLLKQGSIGVDELVVVNCSGHTFSAEKYALEDRYILNLSLDSQAAVRPAEGLAATLEELDEQITTLVIIDDNPYDSRLIRRFMRNYKQYRIYEANNAREGLELVRQRQPDAVMLDLMMPDMDGFEVLDNLKTDPRTARIPVVIVSAKTLEPDEYTKLEQYAASVWQKGRFNPRELVDHVVEILENGTDKTPVMQESHGAGPVTEFGHSDIKHVLLINNYEPEVRLVRRLVEVREQFRVLEAHSGSEALALVDEVTPDLIILDYSLPDIGGEDLLVLLRTGEKTGNTPVLLMVSDDLDNAARTRLGSNVDSIWAKQELDRSSFLGHIERLLNIA